MNKLIFYLFTILNLMGIFGTTSLLFSNIPSTSKTQKKDETSVILKNGYFYIKDKTLREIEGSDGTYWLEAAIQHNPWKKLNIEANISYCKISGNAVSSTTNSNNNLLCTENKFTTIKIPAIGIGLKYFWKHVNLFDLFIGTGLKAFFYRERNNSSYVINSVNEMVIGNVINTGIKITPYKKLIITIFSDYNWATIRPNYSSNNKQNLNISGFVVGIGIGYNI